jgi:hypothetical protein
VMNFIYICTCLGNTNPGVSPNSTHSSRYPSAVRSVEQDSASDADNDQEITALEQRLEYMRREKASASSKALSNNPFDYHPFTLGTRPPLHCHRDNVGNQNSIP